MASRQATQKKSDKDHAAFLSMPAAMKGPNITWGHITSPLIEMLPEPFYKHLLILVCAAFLAMGCTAVKKYNNTSRPLDTAVSQPYRDINKKLWRKKVTVVFRNGSTVPCSDLNVTFSETSCYNLQGQLLRSWPTSEISKIQQSRVPAGALLGGFAGIGLGNFIVYLSYKDVGSSWASLGIPVAMMVATVGGGIIGSRAGYHVTKNKPKTLYDFDRLPSIP